MVRYLIQGQVNCAIRTTPSDSIPLGDTRGTPIDRKTTKTYVVTFVREERRIRRRDRGRTPGEGCTFDGRAAHCWMGIRRKGKATSVNH